MKKFGKKRVQDCKCDDDLTCSACLDATTKACNHYSIDTDMGLRCIYCGLIQKAF